MATPQFILDLREKVGHDPLWVPGVTVIVLRGRGTMHAQTLLVKTFAGEWKPVTGICDPGEQPDIAAKREVREETNVSVEIHRVLWVQAIPEVRYDNGDVCSYMDIAFMTDAAEASAPACVADDENAEVKWFPLRDLPPMDRRYQRLFHEAETLAPTGWGR